ncbi:hypothetical protein B0H16DRAFT_551194 [Mycena metata]|uniref:Uncharacterized protein n=1 Tax=Mycena metata TaxID=1033252 RepID=A0AAD7H6A3_9AGAR|nr:hypothetical protein B0H16DRAFT_551194 [Mycena metata]
MPFACDGTVIPSCTNSSSGAAPSTAYTVPDYNLLRLPLRLPPRLCDCSSSARADLGPDPDFATRQARMRRRVPRTPRAQGDEEDRTAAPHHKAPAIQCNRTSALPPMLSLMMSLSASVRAGPDADRRNALCAPADCDSKPRACEFACTRAASPPQHSAPTTPAPVPRESLASHVAMRPRCRCPSVADVGAAICVRARRRGAHPRRRPRDAPAIVDVGTRQPRRTASVRRYVHSGVRSWERGKGLELYATGRGEKEK